MGVVGSEAVPGAGIHVRHPLRLRNVRTRGPSDICPTEIHVDRRSVVVHGVEMLLVVAVLAEKVPRQVVVATRARVCGNAHDECTRSTARNRVGLDGQRLMARLLVNLVVSFLALVVEISTNLNHLAIRARTVIDRRERFSTAVDVGLS